MKYYIFFMFFLCLLSYGCNQEGQSIKRNSDIPLKEKSKMRLLILKICECFQKKDTMDFSQLLSSNLLPEEKSFFNQMVCGMCIERTIVKPEIIDEFLMKNEPTTKFNKINGQDKFSNKYTYYVKAHGVESYVCIFNVNDSFSSRKWLICSSFNKENGVWKLSSLFAGPYSFNNMPPPQIYQNAKKLNERGEKLSALMYMQICQFLTKAGGPYFKYETDGEMNSFLNKLAVDAKSMVHPMNATKSAVDYFAIVPKYFRGKYIPLLYYKTLINLSDTVRLRKQNEEINKNISIILPGIKNFSDTIIYEVTNTYPLQGKQGNYIEFAKCTK